MKVIEVEPIFLKIKGGWINPAAILSVETHRQNDAMLLVRLVDMDKSIVLNEKDSAYVAEYLDTRIWPTVQQEPTGFVRDGEST
jgi:hypothetical protein